LFSVRTFTPQQCSECWDYPADVEAILQKHLEEYKAAKFVADAAAKRAQWGF
jgi:hypothetical protein